MIVIEPRVEVLKFPTAALLDIEKAARTCYKSEGKTQPGSAESLVTKLKDSGHSAMLEFSDITVKFTTDRAVSHELVRHRMASFAQESQRYVNYKNSGLSFVKPFWADEMPMAYDRWKRLMMIIESEYLELTETGMIAQQARVILPNSTATEIVVKANIREWLHIIDLRCSSAAYPAMRQVMIPLYLKFKRLCPTIFGMSILETPYKYETAKVTYLEGPHD